METRLNHRAASPQAQQAVGPLYTYVKECGLDIGLIDMVWLRISQINGCAYCVDLHYRDALAHGVPARKLNSVVTWEETGFFSPRERAALAWAESLTNIGATHAPDAVYDEVRRQFSEKEVADLSIAIAMINGWNRLCIGARVVHPDEMKKAA